MPQARDRRSPASVIGWTKASQVAGGFRLETGVDQGAVFGEQLADGGGDVFGLNGVVTRQAGKIEQWVHLL
jgi:hypothetical protein